MGTGDWFKNIIGLKRSKNSAKKSNGSNSESFNNGVSKKNAKFSHLTEDVAATKIQSAYRAFKARRALRRLKGIDRFRGVIGECQFSVNNQTSSALNHIHFWSRIQSEIRARWLSMVVDSRARQKRIENQMKLEAKLSEVEVEWSCGPETMEDIVSRIQQREAAAAKRERTLAYAFSHQWRANPNQCFGQSYYDLSKESWGWSWKERWVAVRPWEKRYQSRPSLVKKVEAKSNTNESTNLTSTKAAVSTKPVFSNGKDSFHTRRSSKISQDGVA